MNSRRRERQHPADVSGRDEVPRWTQDMRAHDRSRGDFFLYVSICRSSRSLSKSPLRRSVVLGLHRAQQSDDLTLLGLEFGEK